MPLTLTARCVIILSVCLVVGAIAVSIAPDMDIFLPFHIIACKYYPFAYLNRFRESCDGHFGLTIAGFIPWMRAAEYQGMACSIFYFPLFLLFPYWESALLLAAIFIALSVWFFIRFSGVNPWIALFLFGANFFFIFNQLHDISPVALHVMLLFFIPWMAGQIVVAQGRGRYIALNIALGLLVFLGFEYKLTFIYYVGGGILLAVCGLGQPAGFWQRTALLARKCAPAMLLCGALYALLLSARLEDGRTYWQYLSFELPLRYPPFHTVQDYLWHLGMLVNTYLENFPNSSLLAYDFQFNAAYNWWITLPFWLCAALAYGAFFRQCRLAPDAQTLRCERMVRGCLLAAIITLLLLAGNTMVRYAFHLVPVLAFVIAGMALCVDYLYARHLRVAWALGGMLLLSQLACIAAVASKEARDEFGWSRFPALEYIKRPEIASHALITHIDWGTYYISALYGPKDQMVTYTQELDSHPAWIAALKQIADVNGRYLVLVRKANSMYDLTSVLKVFPSLHRVFPAEQQRSGWEVWSEDAPTARRVDNRVKP